ncbi:MAG: AAA family ATPase [Clostridia bacterium]|nr:AAA family ATPase [Clostridia bacterium]
MDNKEVATGVQDFESMRGPSAFYVDKSDFITQWWEGLDAVTLITRPRRFGKTLNMSMLNCFFSNRYANRGDLFEGLRVWNHQSIRKEQGTWPVIFLSFAGVKGATFEETVQIIKKLIVFQYSSFPELWNADCFDENEKKALNAICDDMSDVDLSMSLYLLSRLLHKYYGKKVLIFLDEYDTPLQEAWLSGYWSELVKLIRTLFNNTFKTNPSLERAVLTGITRVSKESIFSDLNNLVVVTTTSPKYETCFGFTSEEVFHAMMEMGFNETEQAAVKSWYDGFTFGKVPGIYNPWSVVNFLNERKIDVYWTNSSSNGLISRLLQQASAGVKSHFETLMNGGTIRMPLDEQIVFEQLGKKQSAIWSLLLASGYLKVVSVDDSDLYQTSSANKVYYTLTITNREVRKMFEDLITEWFEESEALPEFVRAMLQGNVTDMNRYMNDVALSVFSSFDSGTKPSEKTPERFYHGFVLGLLVDQAPEYDLKSNRESGYGRYDVVLEPKAISRPAVIMEFKVLDAEGGEKSLADTAENALRQIDENKYETDLINRGIPPENILKYGLAFQGKKCLIVKG